MTCALAQLIFEWLEAQKWYDGHFDGEFVVAQTDTAPMSDPMHKGPVRIRPDLTVQVGGCEYAIGKDPIFGVLFAPVDPS